MQLLHKLNPQVEVSELAFPTLLLGNFHIVIVSEPDPETWMANLDETGEFAQILQIHSELIVEELYGEFELPEGGLEIADDVQRNILVAVGETEVPRYYYQAVEFAHAVFKFEEMEYEQLSYYLRGVADQHPDWRVAVVGGVYEDEVVRVANTVQKAGFDTTIVTRYCISSHSLIDIDEFYASMSVEEKLRNLRIFHETSKDEEDDD